jgi:hypothetical protein
MRDFFQNQSLSDEFKSKKRNSRLNPVTGGSLTQRREDYRNNKLFLSYVNKYYLFLMLIFIE